MLVLECEWYEFWGHIELQILEMILFSNIDYQTNPAYLVIYLKGCYSSHRSLENIVDA